MPLTANYGQSIYNLITTSQGRLTAIYPALLAVINNISAYLEGLSPAAASKLMQLFSSMSSPSFLLANDSNHDLLRSLLESINSIVEHQYQSMFNPLRREHCQSLVIAGSVMASNERMCADIS